MEKIFYANKSDFETSEIAVKHILQKYFGIASPVILRSEHGKPYLENEKELKVYFSISHTKEMLFISVSNQNVGIDAENVQREVDYSPIAKKFPKEEQEEICSRGDFLLHWVVKESAVKWLGGTISLDLKKIAYSQEKITYDNRVIPVLSTIKKFKNHLVCVCCEKDFSNAEWISIS